VKWLGNNVINVKSIANVLKSNKSLKSLHAGISFLLLLANIRMGNEEAKYLFDALKENDKLEVLNLGNS